MAWGSDRSYGKSSNVGCVGCCSVKQFWDAVARECRRGCALYSRCYQFARIETDSAQCRIIMAGPSVAARSSPLRRTLGLADAPRRDGHLDGGGHGLFCMSPFSLSSWPLDDPSSSRVQSSLFAAVAALRPRAALAAANIEPPPPGPPLGAVFLCSRDVVADVPVLDDKDEGTEMLLLV